MQTWLDHFTRIGYVSNHRKQVETLERIQQDALTQLFNETNKERRDEHLLIKIRTDIRENVKLLSELGLGTPIISAIKAKLEQKNVQTIQTR